MDDDAFQWDSTKAAANFAKHGVTFEVARRAFEDPFALEQLDDRRDYGEVRYILLGMVNSRLLMVAYTERNGAVRIISARSAEPFERRQYHERNFGED